MLSNNYPTNKGMCLFLACICACVHSVLGIRRSAYYWVDSLWGFRGRRTSIRRLEKHYQVIRPVITPAVRKRSKLTPVWKQSDNANTAARPIHVCMYICKYVWWWVHMCARAGGRWPPYTDCGCANCQIGEDGWLWREHIWREFIV